MSAKREFGNYMRKELLSLLMCIYCKKTNLKLEILQKNSSEIITGLLKCECSASYEIKKGIPVMLKKEVHPLKSRIAGAFAYEWKKFSQLYKEYESQFLDWIYPIDKEFFKERLVLDAGCGTGRHSFFSSKYGARVISIDLGESVFVAKKNLENTSAEVVQADIYDLPFKENTFDYIYSIGVLHHLPNPQKGFNNLIKKLKNKGAISIWVYGGENNLTLKIVNPVRKYFFSILPLQTTKTLALATTISIIPLMYFYNFLENIKIPEFLKKFFPQYHFMIYLSKLNFKIVHSIVFDQMLAPVANYYYKKDFEKWFTDAKLKNVRITHRNKNSWRGFAIK